MLIIYQKMLNQTIETKFNESSNHLINGLALYNSLIKNNIDKGKKFKLKPVDSSIKNNEKNISCSVEKNEYKLLNISSLHCMYPFMNIVTLGYSVFHRYLEESGYYFIDLGFIYLYNASYIYKIYASCPLLVN